VVAVYSDGGGERGSSAAAACIIDSERGRERIVVGLGGATNNESEIFGGLLGITIIAARSGGSAVIDWYSDSEYTLKSASVYILNWQKNGWRTANRQAVKNLGLWRTYLEAKRNLTIHPHHVRGHSGHPENEECDRICTQVQGLQLGRKLNPGLITARDGNQWILLDGAQIMEALRDDEPDVLEFINWASDIQGAAGITP